MERSNVWPKCILCPMTMVICVDFEQIVKKGNVELMLSFFKDHLLRAFIIISLFN